MRNRVTNKPLRAADRITAIINSVDGIVWEAEVASLRFTFVGDKAEKILGYPAKQWLEDPDFWKDHLHPEDRNETIADCAAAVAAGRSHILKYRMLAADGREVWLQDSVSVVSENGRAVALRGIMIDITERKRAEVLLGRTEERYRMLFDCNPMPMWVYDPETLRVLDVNEAAIRHYGYSRDEFLSLGLLDLRPADGAQALIEYMESLRFGPMPARIWTHRKKDGTLISVEVTKRDISYEGRPARLALAHDVTEREQAADALRRSEALLRALSDTMPQLVWGADGEGRICYSNDRTVQFTGLSAEELRGEAWVQALHPEEKERVMARWRHSVSTGEDYEIQYRLRRADGVYRWQLSRAVRVDGTRAETIQWFGTNTDIEDQIRAQIQLDEAQRITKTGSWAMELRSGEVTWSAELYRIFGVAPGSITPSFEAALTFVHPDDRAAFLANDERARIELRPFEGDHRIVRPDGAVRCIHQRVEVELDLKGRPHRVYGIARDVTEIRAAEEQIRKQANLLNLAHDAIMVRDLDDRVEFWNQGAERLYGWSPKEAHGKRITELLYEDTTAYFAAKNELVEKGEWNGELRQLRKDGDVVIVNCRWSLVRDETGEAVSVFAINDDITDRKKLETQFLRAQRLESIGTLASGVAHDLNNVLLPILMVAPLLRGGVTDADREKFLDIVEASAERGASIVKQVLTFARGADGTRLLLQAAYLLEEIAKIAQETFPKAISIETRFPENLRMLEGDSTQLHQVLLNLCVNARDAMPAGGNLTLSAENFDVDEHYASMIPGAKAGPHVLLRVTDTGTGIPRNIIDKIFDPFFTTKEIGVGTGLGLSTVLGIVKSHGGFMNVYSEPGHTSFSLFLPALGEEISSSSPPEPELPAGRGENILFVDDEPAIRVIAKALLENNGYQVMIAEDGPSALALFAREWPSIQLVVTDMAMPFMSGMSLARTLRRMNPEVKIIISTGREEECRPTEMKDLEVQACLAKPFTRKKLLETIAQVFSAAAPVLHEQDPSLNR